LIKAHEFCQDAARAVQSDSFFLVASLRGICEDYISLRFIYEQAKPEKHKIVFSRMMAEAHESSIAQWDFFKENHASQKLYCVDNVIEELKQFRDEIKTLLKGHPIRNSASMPAVHYMAKTTGLLPLYQYVYHATSQFVHFSPRLLLRMGWGGPPKFNFSTKNFGDYYNHFAIFYGIFLLIAIFEWLSRTDVDVIQSPDSTSMSVLRDYIEKTSRWPELVTFEEMNIGVLGRILFHKAPDEPK